MRFLFAVRLSTASYFEQLCKSFANIVQQVIFLGLLLALVYTLSQIIHLIDDCLSFLFDLFVFPHSLLIKLHVSSLRLHLIFEVLELADALEKGLSCESRCKVRKWSINLLSIKADLA